jgi:hypothetical protein
MTVNGSRNQNGIMHLVGGNMKLKEYIIEKLDEASYEGNIGFEEMTQFWKLASKKDIKAMDKMLLKTKPSFEEFKELIRKVVGTELE